MEAGFSILQFGILAMLSLSIYERFIYYWNICYVCFFITIIIVALSIDGVNIGRMYTIFRFPSHVATLTTLKEIPYYLLDPSALGWNDP